MRTLRVALVQGGGTRGLSDLEIPPSVVYTAALRATRRVRPPVDLVLWPEDVVALSGPLRGSPESGQLAAIARRLRATLVAGVTETVGAKGFRNEIVAYSPSGALAAVFEKVHRVPFGEYVPWRSFFSHLANLRAIPRDAVAGHGSGLMATPAGDLAVLVSYEVFFPDRGRSGVRAGGRIIVVPTNTSSYPSEQAPAQEIAASRLQAIEEGRDLLQVAPTGYSAVIDNRGRVLQETSLSVSGRAEGHRAAARRGDGVHALRRCADSCLGALLRSRGLGGLRPEAPPGPGACAPLELRQTRRTAGWRLLRPPRSAVSVAASSESPGASPTSSPPMTAAETSSAASAPPCTRSR